MKYLLLAFILILPASLYASDEIDVFLSESTALLWERVHYKVRIVWENTLNGNEEIQIPWIENFEIFSQSFGTSVQNINGKVESTHEYTFSLQTPAPWSYDIWPVSIIFPNWNILQDDATVSLEITQWPIITNDIPSSEDIQVPWKTSELKWLREIPFPVLVLLILCALFFVIFFLTLKWYLSRVNFKDATITQQEISSLEEDVYGKYFDILEEKYTGISHSEFYRLFNAGVRNIMLSQWYINAPSATLREVKSQSHMLGNEIISIFSKSYENEFSMKHGEISERKKLMGMIRGYLQKQ